MTYKQEDVLEIENRQAEMQADTTKDRMIGAAIILTGFFAATKARAIIGLIGGDATELDPTIRQFMVYGIQLVICLGCTILVIPTSKSNILEMLGLKREILKGLGITLLATSPMLIGFAVTSPFNSELTGVRVMEFSILPGFMEEVLFRGFLFGLFFRQIRIGFFPVILLVSILFGAGHLYQGNDLGSTLGVFLITAVGSGLFAWLYIEWNSNLWVPIGMHILMNLYWDMFVIDASTALGGMLPNVFRFATVILIIVMTIMKIKKGKSHLKGKSFRLVF